MRALPSLAVLSLAFLLPACSGGDEKGDGDTGEPATGDTDDTQDTADTDDTQDTADTADSGDTGTGPIDEDGDGYDVSEDCDDTDPAVNPGAEEVPGDGIDNDCDESTCAGTGFSGATTPLTLPEGFGARSFTDISSPGDCDGNRPRFMLLDLTGDGLEDIVVLRSPCGDVEPGMSTWDHYTATSAGFPSTPTNWTLPTDLPAGSLITPGNPTGCDGSGRPRWALRDINGDALLDIVLTEDCDDAGLGLGTTHWQVHLNNSAGFDTATTWALPAGASTEAFHDFTNFADCDAGRPASSLMDIDHDGDDDLVVTQSPCADDATGVTEWLVYDNDGTGFASTGTRFALPGSYGIGTFYAPGHGGDCPNEIPTWSAQDIDGDGFLDAIITWLDCDDSTVGTTEWRVHAGSATGFSNAPSTWTLPTAYGVDAFDALGGDVDCDSNQPRYFFEDLDGDDRPELIVTRSPCEDDDVGEARWITFRSTGTAFSATGDDWILPTGYGAETFLRPGAIRECSPGIPGWTLRDVDNDGYSDVLVTASACLDDEVGATIWAAHLGGCSL